MAAPVRTQFQREDHYQQITALYLRGTRQADIGAQLGLSRQQIGYDLKTIQKRWQTATAINLDEAKQRELARIDELEREYWQAWEASRGEKAKAKQETGTQIDKKTGRPVVIKIVTEKEKLLGNPAYLNGVQWCITERCKLLGLYISTLRTDGQPRDGSGVSAQFGNYQVTVQYVDDPDVE